MTDGALRGGVRDVMMIKMMMMRRMRMRKRKRRKLKNIRAFERPIRI